MEKEVSGLLYSQIGYDLSRPMRAVVRGPRGALSSDASYLLLRAQDASPARSGKVVFWGEIWGSCWWVADFSGAEVGEYDLVVLDKGLEAFRGGRFLVEEDLLWKRTWRKAAISQGQVRQRFARDHVGWNDAGAPWQEANSHAAQLGGLCDLLEFASDSLSELDREEIEDQILNGCDYLVRLQDRAAELPEGKGGALVHQIFKYDSLILPQDVEMAALAWARAARWLSDRRAEKKELYLSRAESAANWLDTAQPLGDCGFSRINNGVRPGEPIPLEWPTRSLAMRLWADFELVRLGRKGHEERCAPLAARILARQVGRERPEGGFYGHFRNFDSATYTEKAWVHNCDGGVFGSDNGGQFPHYLVPLIRMRQAWPDHPEAALWERSIRDFAYGYFAPACQANPFFLLPLGYFEGVGLLSFAGLWHGMNAAYGWAAALALEFARLLGDEDGAFQQIAAGNLQWIAGLNAGVTAESLFASHLFKMDVPEGAAIPCSMFHGVGANQAGCWMNIQGAICNGFSVGDQFTHDVLPSVEADGPHAFTDEDWITHTGGWLSGLARLQSAAFRR